jgi:hypothetical protein
MPKTTEISVNANNSNILTASNCTTAVIRNYFQYILLLSKSGEQFPVNLNDVFFLAHTRKDNAVRALTSDDLFIQGVDYQIVLKNEENSKRGRKEEIYMMTIPCLEYFIARKVRPVFEVYRQVFHAAPDVAMKVRADKTKVAKLEKRIESLERQIKIVQGISKYETELKCSCFSFLTYTGLYLKWEEYRKGDISKEDLKVIGASYR